MVDIGLPTVESLDKSTKDYVLSVLASEYPLSVTKIYNKIKKKFGVSITYQAVHKTLGTLLKSGIVAKEGKLYKLERAWIDRTAQFFDDLKSYYGGENKKKLPNILEIRAGKDVQILNFNSYMEADNFRFRLQHAYLMADEGEHPYCVHVHHLKRAFFSPTTYMMEGQKKLKNSFVLVQGHTPIDVWCEQFFKKTRDYRVNYDIPCPNNTEVFVLGDITLELHAPADLWEDFDDFYNKAQTVSKIDVYDFLNNIFLKKRKVQVVVYNDKSFSEKARNSILSYFKKPKVDVKTKVKLVAFDVNGALTPKNTIVDLASFTENKEKVKELITSQTLGRLSIVDAFKEVGNLLKGITLYDFYEYSNIFCLTKGIMSMAKSLKKEGIYLVIITTGFDVVMDILNSRASNLFDYIVSNSPVFLDTDGRRLTYNEVKLIIEKKNIERMKEIKFSGDIILNIDDPSRKTQNLRNILKRRGLSFVDCAVVGDSMGDSDMIKLCSDSGGLGIAFNPNSALVEYARFLIEGGGNVELIEEADLKNISDRVLKEA